MIFKWKGGSSEGQPRGDEGCIAHVLKKGKNGYMADLWEYEGKVILDLTTILGDPEPPGGGDLRTGRIEISKTDLNKSSFETPEEWADNQLAQFLETETKWRRP